MLDHIKRVLDSASMAPDNAAALAPLVVDVSVGCRSMTIVVEP